MKKVTFDEFKNKADEIHNGFYQYDESTYKCLGEKIRIICPEHGEFWQRASNHLSGVKCPKCASNENGKKRKITLEDFIKRAKEVHGDKYDYSKVEYVKSTEKVCIICPEHGEFWQIPSAHLNGQGCPKCGIATAHSKQKKTTEQFILDLKEKNKNNEFIDYSLINYVNAHTPVKLICHKVGADGNEHGVFEQIPNSSLGGCGCPKCANERRGNWKKLDTESFIELSKSVHGDEYIYDKSKYIDSHTPLIITCKKHGDFEQTPNAHLCGKGCPVCGKRASRGENEIYEFLVNDLKIKNVEKRNRKVLKEFGQELDIIIGDNIAIEYDGLRWHSEAFKPKNYHLMKTIECEKKGIRLIHIFEDEWIYKKDICKSMLKSILGLNENKIYARKCKILEIPAKLCNTFLNHNHIQGSCQSTFKYGLFYNDELVSVMTFGKSRHFIGNSSHEYELLRFCNKINTTVVGGASKLLKYFINQVKPKNIVSYADRRWSNGNLYETLGFTLYNISKPNYFYFTNTGIKRENRFSFRKSILMKKYNCPKNISEHDFCLSKKWYRIYDCGHYCYELNF